MPFQVLLVLLTLTIFTNPMRETNALKLSPSEERAAAFILERLRSNDYGNTEDYDRADLQNPSKRAIKIMRLG
ncbi:hypothetical protein EG68_08684 [Paragonimus skrjabini miyazakii]|uniref:Uncharacterized protein n=1 Tax=Paragonimus skrjabini miyazakii TaxID=59628 RepID=A0A8S9YP80_9TREM|nr:hypothetical protein EG68_08684 [Paragonimus skrjabini miyazakii]